MKVNSNKDSVELSHLSRSKQAGKAGGVKGKGAEEANSAATAGTGIETASVEISSEAKAMSAAKGAAKAGDVDEAKIARVKAMINGGTYKPDFGKVADKMVNETLLQDLS